MLRDRRLTVIIAVHVSLLAATAVAAQSTTCKTGNCTVGTGLGNPIRPAECQNIASPRLVKVDMDGATYSFIPSNPRIEGESSTPGVPWEYECIQWHNTGSGAVLAHSATDETGGAACNTSTACTATNTTPPCDWETGNIDNSFGLGLKYSVCHYMKIAPTTRRFGCRFHASVGMQGVLTVVQPIQLVVNKGASGEAMLAWSIGGIGPWDVNRDATGAMPAPSNLAPPSTTLRSLTDATTLPSGAQFFYLVTEHN